MPFEMEDYERAGRAFGADPLHAMAVAAIEASGENFWTMPDGSRVPPIRPEAHWFSRKTAGAYDNSHPHISRPSWTPSVAAKTRSEAWRQYEEMKSLNPEAAAESTSWGPFQIMGFHWKSMGYNTVWDFVDDMDGPSNDEQMDAFVKFVKKDPTLLRAIRRGDWDTWELRYNGGGYGGAYAEKIRNWLAANRNLQEGRGAGEDGLNAPRPLFKGMRGEDVKRLQRALKIEADGMYGPATEAAVREFQSENGLTVDGIAGKFTKEALGVS